nr:protein FAR-RED ELONGATED HYPOCOTYL 3-like [Nicotiana tomentosiformis]
MGRDPRRDIRLMANIWAPHSFHVRPCSILDVSFVPRALISGRPWLYPSQRRTTLSLVSSSGNRRREEGIKELHQQPANNGGRSMPLWSGHVKELSSAALTGWQYCKPVVAVDGTFLKSTYRGTLLIASAQDPTGSILPLAYAIVDSENNASWEWFFVRFKDAFGERKRMCIVSDMHEGIKNTAATLYPQVPHCVCIWHLWNNINTNYKKNHLQLKDIFFAMTKAYTIEKFDYHMAEVDRIDKRVKDSLINVGYERWSRAHFTVNRTLTMTSNIAESINAMLKTARELPVLPLLEYIRQLIGRWNVTNQKNAIESFIDLGKKYDTMLMDNLELSHRMKA